MGKKFGFVKGILSNNVRFCEFALTNVCSAQCTFCSIWKQKPKVFVDREKALKTIDKLAEVGVRFITLTGGEPLIHPNVVEIVQKCTDCGIISSVLDADPRLLTKEKVDGLKKAGIDYFCISIDHYDDKVLYESRKIKGLLKKIRKGVRICKKTGVHITASILISKFNHDCLEKLFKKCESLGFDTISINYPEFSESPVYTLGGEGINLTKEETINALREVIRLKKKGYKINNQVISMNNIIKYLNGEKPDFPCYGGSIVLFVDWFFKVYPCMHLPNNFGDVLELDKKKLRKIPCNKCNMSWYRDFSIYFNGLGSIRPIMDVLKDSKNFI